MYENQTYETIRARMLARVSSTADRREGSLICDAVSPAAAECAQLYIEADYVLKETYADTAGRAGLVKRCAERGITPYSATCAEGTAELLPASVFVPLGSRFSDGEASVWGVMESLGDGLWRVVCETPGSAANGRTGRLVPLQYVEGLESAELIAVTVPARDEEATESLRSRYYASLGVKPFGGNAPDYRERCLGLGTVGGVKVDPVWNGGGTVKLVITSADGGPASDRLVADVKEAFDPPPEGTGLGLAPIGHVVTVVSAEAVPVTVVASLSFSPSSSWEAVSAAAAAAVERHLADLRASWASSQRLIVRITGIESALLSVPGVIDVSGTTLNGSEDNLVLGPWQIPTFGGLANE